MADKPIRCCKLCGKQLANKQSKFCSNECFHKSLASTEQIYKCKVCGKEIRSTGGRVRKFCSNECSFTNRKGSKIKTRLPTTDEAKNRPYTKDTKYFIRLWYNEGEGMKKKEIAELLDRSLENIELAFL